MGQSQLQWDYHWNLGLMWCRHRVLSVETTLFFFFKYKILKIYSLRISHMNIMYFSPICFSTSLRSLLYLPLWDSCSVLLFDNSLSLISAAHVCVGHPWEYECEPISITPLMTANPPRPSSCQLPVTSAGVRSSVPSPRLCCNAGWRWSLFILPSITPIYIPCWFLPGMFCSFSFSHFIVFLPTSCSRVHMNTHSSIFPCS